MKAFCLAASLGVVSLVLPATAQPRSGRDVNASHPAAIQANQSLQAACTDRPALQATKTSIQVKSVAQPPAALASSGPAPAIGANKSCETHETAAGLSDTLARISFHDATLDRILNYFSDAYGFIVMGKRDVEGNFNVIANRPLSARDAVDLLNIELAKSNYRAVQSGRTLQIMTVAEARQSAQTPVVGPPISPASIPINETVVTQILPVHSLSPSQLTNDLRPLFAEHDTLIADETGNALLMTAPQCDIHRLAEMVQALDSSGVSDVRVFFLKYGDAKSVAQELKDVFTDPNARQNNFRYMLRMRFGDGDPDGHESARVTPIPVNTVCDDQNNALLVSAPAGFMSAVSNLVGQLDQPSEDVTIVRVFHLTHADPCETVYELMNLFPDDAGKSLNSVRSMGYQYLRPSPGQTAADQTAAGMKRRSRLTAVADRRTDSVIVTASRNLMDQIAAMVADLDNPDPNRDTVASIPIASADPSEVQKIMQDLFQDAKARRSQSSQATTALQQRQIQTSQQQSSSVSGFGLAGQKH